MSKKKKKNNSHRPEPEREPLTPASETPENAPETPENAPETPENAPETVGAQSDAQSDAQSGGEIAAVGAETAADAAETKSADAEAVNAEAAGAEAADAEAAGAEAASADAPADGKTDFERSLDDLKASDLAPASKKRKNKKAVLPTLLWCAVALLLLGVAVWSGMKVVSNLIDYSDAQNRYEEMANEFSPVSKKVQKPVRLTESAPFYAIGTYDELIAGKVVYPTEPSLPDTPSPSLPSETPDVSTDPTADTSPAPTEPTGTTETPTHTPTLPATRELDNSDPELAPEKVLAFRESLYEMRRSYNNNDIFGWIHIEGASIDYPLVRGDDNDYYLNHDPKKKSTGYGSIYLDCRNNTDLRYNQVSVIYGHNIRKDGTMFNRLLDYRNAKLFFHRNYRYIYIYTENAILKYEVFSAYETNAYQAPTGVLRYPTQEAFLEKMAEVEKLSVHHLDSFTPMRNDNVILLYTCANSTYETERWIVFGVLVGVGTA